MQLKHAHITAILEKQYPLYLQESYDNAGYIVGSKEDRCRGVLVGFDCTMDVVEEAIEKKCNLIITHHPLIFKSLKNIGTEKFPEDVVRLLIKHDLTHYAAHTNLDNAVFEGVSASFINYFSLRSPKPLLAKQNLLQKMIFYVPVEYADTVSNALFDEGAGHIGKYSHCSFSSEGEGSFLPQEGSTPFLGEQGQLQREKEKRIEIIFPVWLKNRLIQVLKERHPYEEVAYDIVSLQNESSQWGSGVIGELPSPLQEEVFLDQLKLYYHTPSIRCSTLKGKPIQRVAFCGGSGSSFIDVARSQSADIFVTGDLTYHHFLDQSKSSMRLADIGHWESEQYAVEVLYQSIHREFTNFAVHKQKNRISPVYYY